MHISIESDINSKGLGSSSLTPLVALISKVRADHIFYIASHTNCVRTVISAMCEGTHL